MNRYLIITSGFLLGLNELRMLIGAHWIVINNTYEIVDFVMMALLILSGIVNNKNFYNVTLIICAFITVLALAGFYNIYFRRDYPLSMFAFVRPVLLLMALYNILKSLHRYNTSISN
jgi:ABC-type uncharacterized transport system permease subunit